VTSPLLRARDVAKLLSISEAMVYALAKTGKLPPTTFQAWQGKRSTVRFTAAAVQSFIDTHTNPSPERGRHTEV